MTERQSRPLAAVELSVPFHDVDALRVVWHGHYLKYFEIARDALFEQYGVNLYALAEGLEYLFPVVRTATKHIHPLRWGDHFVCEATLTEAAVKLVVEFTIRLQPDGVLCARGRTEQVAVAGPALELQYRIPEAVRRAFGLEP